MLKTRKMCILVLFGLLFIVLLGGKINYYNDKDKIIEAPYGVRISTITDEGIEVYWKKPDNKARYEVWRSIDGEEYMKIVEDIRHSEFTYVDNSFDRMEKTFYYKLRAYEEDRFGKRFYSEFSEVTEAIYKTELAISSRKMIMPSNTERELYVVQGWKERHDLVWFSEDTNIANVSQDGIVTAVSKGKTKIKAKDSENGEWAECTIIVDRNPIDIVYSSELDYFYVADEGVWKKKDTNKSNCASIALVGDVMCTGAQQRMARNENGDYLFDKNFLLVKPYIEEADLAVCNLETMISNSYPYMIEEGYINNKPNCNAPVTIVDALIDTGFDMYMQANNHNCDTGIDGIIQTVNNMNRYNIPHTGLFKGDESEKISIVDVNGIKIGFIAYVSGATGYNQKDKSFSQEQIDTHLNYFDIDKCKKDVENLKKRGCDYIICYMHWGVKNCDITKTQREEAKQVAESGVDYIVGNHSHIIQEYDIIKTKDGKNVPCFYSLGNFASSMNQIEGNRDSVILKLKLEKKGNECKLKEENYLGCYILENYNNVIYSTIPLTNDFIDNYETFELEPILERIKKSVGKKLNEMQCA